MILNDSKRVIPVIKNALDYSREEDPYAEYEIEIGIDLFIDLQLEHELMYKSALVLSKDEQGRIFDIPFRVNYFNPKILKMWKNIM